MKKIEELQKLKNCIGGGEIEYNINILADKICELVEAHNQEVSQPEENLGWGDTELKFEKCDKNLLESIFGEDKRDEEDKKLDQRIIESHEDNTEEWKEKFREIDSAYDRGVRGGTGRGEVDWQLEDRYIEFIEQLISEKGKKYVSDLWMAFTRLEEENIDAEEYGRIRRGIKPIVDMMLRS